MGLSVRNSCHVLRSDTQSTLAMEQRLHHVLEERGGRLLSECCDHECEECEVNNWRHSECWLCHAEYCHACLALKQCSNCSGMFCGQCAPVMTCGDCAITI